MTQGLACDKKGMMLQGHVHRGGALLGRALRLCRPDRCSHCLLRPAVPPGHHPARAVMHDCHTSQRKQQVQHARAKDVLKGAACL